MSHARVGPLNSIVQDLSLPVFASLLIMYRMVLEANLHEVLGLSYGYGKSFMVMETI